MQQGNCGSARGCNTNDVRIVVAPDEMFLPLVLSWVKKRDLNLSLRINRRRLNCLVTVAALTG